MERRVRGHDLVRLREHAGEGLGVGEAAVRDRVQVGEVEHRSHPVELGGDREHVVGRAEVAHTAHHLDPERHVPALPLQPFAQLTELLDHRRDRLLVRPSEQEPGVEDDDLHTGGLGDPGRVVEHADRHPVLLAAVEVAEERRQRGVHRQDEVAVAGQLP